LQFDVPFAPYLLTPQGDTPIIVASHKCTGDNELAHHFVGLVNYLAHNGANVNSTNNDGSTAFSNAVWNKVWRRLRSQPAPLDEIHRYRLLTTTDHLIIFS
jgi:hypothetical protein